MTDEKKQSFQAPVPVLRVADLEASLSYYVVALGFAVRWRWHTDFACVAQQDCVFFLTTDNQSQPRMWVWIGVEDCRALHAHYLEVGAKIRNPPYNFGWGLEMQVEDLDGNVLRIGSEREENAEPPVWRDGDGVGWRHLPDGKYERVD